jgi:hypothetical protein
MGRACVGTFKVVLGAENYCGLLKDGEGAFECGLERGLLEDGEGVLGTFKRWWMVGVAGYCWRTERAHLNAFWRESTKSQPLLLVVKVISAVASLQAMTLIGPITPAWVKETERCDFR